jgi:hypothetical protein
MTVRWRALLVAAACAMALPAPAHAAASIAIHAPDDPIESDHDEQNIALGISGTAASSSNRAWLHINSPSAGCGADPRQDAGAGFFNQPTGSGDYSFSANTTFEYAGSSVLCAWLTDENQNGAVVATDSRPFNVRIPHLSLSIVVPPVVMRGATFQLALIAQAEAGRHAWLDVLPDTGSGCPATQSAAQAPAGSALVLPNYPVFGGPTTIPVSRSLGTAGSYLACAYFHKSVYHANNIAIEQPPEATAQASFRVVPPCVVPRRVVGLVRQRNCTLGRTKHVRSRRYRRGRVTGASVPLGKNQAPARLVHLAVSTGRPPVRHR